MKRKPLIKALDMIGVFDNIADGVFRMKERMDEAFMQIEITDDRVQIYEIRDIKIPIDVFNLENFDLKYLESYEPWRIFIKKLNNDIIIEERDMIIEEIINKC